jgi:hypothetical protein
VELVSSRPIHSSLSTRVERVCDGVEKTSSKTNSTTVVVLRVSPPGTFTDIS